MNLLAGNFTHHNFKEYAIQYNIIVDQSFYYIKNINASREVSLLNMTLIKYKLVTDEVKFIKVTSILLQSYAPETQREDSWPKFANRLFDSLESLFDLNIPALV